MRISMFNLPLAKKYLLGPVLLILIAVVIQFTALNELLTFNRQSIDNGAYWLIWTGQFTHANSMHLLLNGLGIVFIWLLHGEYYNPISYLKYVAVLALTTGLGIYWFCPDIGIYTGLSGLLHGVILFGTLEDIARKRKDGWLLLLGVCAKLVWEQIVGPSADVSALIESTVATDAHLIGALSGVGLFLLVNATRIQNALKKPA
ncbi:rhombosortase [Pseudoalteromonas fenneropenaei]|uniref:Rhombosortase n=1 Tax=Pseudoalteromonas fenneropenaei TaxID=1737459 RepID=A0ABV7CFH4_9GAMM